MSIQLAAGIIANYFDFRYPFSAGKQVAHFISANKINAPLIEGNNYYAGITVAGYLNKNIYYPQSDRWGSFVIFDKKSDVSPGFALIYEKSCLISRQKKTDVMILSGREQDTSLFHLEKMAEFNDSTIVEDERYYLYKIPFAP